MGRPLSPISITPLSSFYQIENKSNFFLSSNIKINNNIFFQIYLFYHDNKHNHIDDKIKTFLCKNLNILKLNLNKNTLSYISQSLNYIKECKYFTMTINKILITYHEA